MNETKNNKPPFYNTVDLLFHKVMDSRFVSNNFKYCKDHPGLSASFLGAAGTLATLGSIDVLAKELAPRFHQDNFSLLEGLGITAMTGTLIFYSDKLSEWAKAHPVYAPGMIGVIASSYAYAIGDLIIK